MSGGSLFTQFDENEVGSYDDEVGESGWGQCWWKLDFLNFGASQQEEEEEEEERRHQQQTLFCLIFLKCHLHWSSSPVFDALPHDKDDLNVKAFQVVICHTFVTGIWQGPKPYLKGPKWSNMDSKIHWWPRKCHFCFWWTEGGGGLINDIFNIAIFFHLTFSIRIGSRIVVDAKPNRSYKTFIKSWVKILQ